MDTEVLCALLEDREYPMAPEKRWTYRNDCGGGV